MKKFKEFVKKIGNKKRCLLLLLAGLLIFAIVSGLNGSKSAVTQVNAQSAPTIKNLDLNGVRYTYKTSLKELKNNYGFFNSEYGNPIYYMSFGLEGDSCFSIVQLSGDGEYNEDNYNQAIEILNKSIQFKYKESNSFINVETSKGGVDLDNAYPYFFLDNIKTTKNLESVIFNINELNKLPKTSFDFKSRPVIFTFIYVKDNLKDYNNFETVKANSIFLNYIFTKPISYQFNLPKYEGYSLRNIYPSYQGDGIVDEFTINSNIIQNIGTQSNQVTFSTTQIFIDKLEFFNNEDANILKFNSDFELNYGLANTYFKGNILLSDNFDNNLIETIGSNTNIDDKKGVLNFNRGAIFGGNFENKKLINSIYFIKDENVAGSNMYNVKVFSEENPNLSSYILFDYIGAGLPVARLNYYNQNKLLYLPSYNDLNVSVGSETYDGLAKQVSDVLYDVNYLGDVVLIERNQKVQEDAFNVVKTVGLGAVGGLIVGALIGNPVGGLIVGAVGGLIVGIGPLLIDGLQAIFGDNFAVGLYNFFKSITMFFVNIVDTLFNFLFAMLTNPFVLIFILIVAILYIFVFRKRL